MSIQLTDLAAMPVTDIADRIGIALSDWPGQCYGIASLLAEHGLVPSGTRVVYGHWRGPISPESPFANRAGIGFTGHGWLETPSGRVVDPTRWVFEHVDPYIYLGADPDTVALADLCAGCEHLRDEHEGFLGRCSGGDEVGYDCGCIVFEAGHDPQAADDDEFYDEGGNRYRAATMRPMPAPDPQARTLDAEPSAAVTLLLAEHGHPGGPVSFAQAHWLANLPLPALGGAAPDVYRWLIAAGCVALIPYDNRLTVFDENPTAA